MYEQFYGFKENPFQVDPRPDYLYLSTKHQNALTYLEYGLMENIGIIMLSGEIGSGKTTLTQYMIKKLDSAAEIAYIPKPNSSPDQLLSLILNKFRLSAKRGRAATLDVFKRFLEQKHSEQKQVYIVIDDTQNLPAEALEEVWMLSNVQAENHAFLQIMLVGEPQFINMINNSKYREFARRIAVHYHLTGLDRRETGNYISFRLQKAGGRPHLFTPDAVDSIYRITRGIPHSINLQCQAALVYGYAVETGRIDNMIIEQIARDKIGIEPQLHFENSLADAEADSQKEDEILRRLKTLEEKINVMQGHFPPRLQIEEQRAENFKDNLISQLLQFLINERQNSEELLLRYSRHSNKLENLNRPEKTIQNDKGNEQDEGGKAEYISFNQKKRRRFSE